MILKIIRKIGVLGIVLGAMTLISCTHTSTWRTANAQVEKTQDDIRVNQSDFSVHQPAVVVDSGFYTSHTPQILNDQPIWLKQIVHVQGRDLPLNVMVQDLLSGTPAVAHFDQDVPQHQRLSLNFQGSLQDALGAISAKSNTHFQRHGNILDWRGMMQKTFNISFMPGTTNYLVGQTADNNGSQGGTSNVETTIGQLASPQFSNLRGSLSVWKDLSKTLDQLRSNEGRVMLSEASSAVTVLDHPSEVRAIGDYINQLNKDLSKEVNIKVQVLDIELNKEFNYGIDWQMVERMLGAKVSLAGALGSSAAVAADVASGGAAMLGGLTAIRVGNSSHAVLNALSKQGKLSVVTQPTVTTMNNQPAEIRITKDTGYLKSIMTTSVANEGTHVALTPGKVTDGLTLFLLPKIQKDQIFLQISSSISTLKSLNKVGNATSSDKETQAIQVPTLSEKHFNQRTRIRSGSTLVITGFKQLRDEVQKNALLGVDPLGGKGAKHSNVQTLVLITPTLIENEN